MTWQGGEKSEREVRKLRQQDEAKIFARGFHEETLMREGEMSMGSFRKCVYFFEELCTTTTCPFNNQEL